MINLIEKYFPFPSEKLEGKDAISYKLGAPSIYIHDNVLKRGFFEKLGILNIRLEPSCLHL